MYRGGKGSSAPPHKQKYIIEGNFKNRKWKKSKNFSLYVAPRVPMSFLKQIQPIRFSRLVSHSKHRNERGALLYRLKLNSYFFCSFSFLKMSFTISNKNTKITYNKMQIFQKHVFFCQFCLSFYGGGATPQIYFCIRP